MRRKRKALGESMADQVDKRRGLKNRRIGHQEVFTGELADQALGALGARAMTVDNEIVVNNQFNANQAEDQALLAHEMLHQEFSGGVAGSSMRDAEEIAARSVESMVFHRAKNGDSSPIPRKASELLEESKGKTGGANSAKIADGEADNEKPKSEKGYQTLTERGFSHEMIVQHLTFKVMDEMERKNMENIAKTGNIKGFLE
jgi:hypothetical protein